MTAVDHDPVVAAAELTQLDGISALRPITRDAGRILCEGAVVHRGRTVATAEARLTAGERLLAHGTASILILPSAARTASTAPPASASG